ncbi:methyl farnesoate epoxidase-like [Gigantopelta aegis]|uniref:methyl farnesoate epoxidase-like n=1 Tax=Gigantopelta aegis TaxID=1735272 RepID=UPI001B887675|nr:methyl farnesoate epoxidase-like [Gigantopelta aegis]
MDVVFAVSGVTGILLTVAASLICFTFIRRRQLPPGPWGVPLLGCLPFWKGPETNSEWYNQYGDIYSVRMGSSLIVYLNSMPLVNKYLKDSVDIIDRPPGPAAIGQGILFGSGQKWRLNRTLCLHTLWGDKAEQAFHRHLQNEATDLLAQLERFSEREMNLTETLRPCIVNGLCTLIRGSRFSYTDPDFVSLVALLRGADDVDLLSLSTALSVKLPKLWALIPHQSPDLAEITAGLASVIGRWVAERRQSCEKYSSDSLIDVFLNSEQYQQINSTDDEMVQSAIDMFNGGLVASLSGLEFLFLYLIHNPDVQSRIQGEIDDAIGSDRKPSWVDQSKLPYTVATVMETLRLACITPSTLPHVATRDVTVHGYSVPKGSGVVASIFCLHRQSAQHEDPETFNPERFLNKDSTLRTPSDFIPFGVAPRNCPGDRWFHVLAFLILTWVLQSYSVSQPQGEELPPFKTKMRIVRRLEPYSLVLTPRKTSSKFVSENKSQDIN